MSSSVGVSPNKKADRFFMARDASGTLQLFVRDDGGGSSPSTPQRHVLSSSPGRRSQPSSHHRSLSVLGEVSPRRNSPSQRPSSTSTVRFPQGGSGSRPSTATDLSTLFGSPYEYRSSEHPPADPQRQEVQAYSGDLEGLTTPGLSPVFGRESALSAASSMGVGGFQARPSVTPNSEWERGGDISGPGPMRSSFTSVLAFSPPSQQEADERDPYGSHEGGRSPYGIREGGKNSCGDRTEGKNSYGTQGGGKNSYGDHEGGKSSLGHHEGGKTPYGDRVEGKNPYGTQGGGENSYGDHAQDNKFPGIQGRGEHDEDGTFQLASSSYLAWKRAQNAQSPVPTTSNAASSTRPPSHVKGGDSQVVYPSGGAFPRSSSNAPASAQVMSSTTLSSAQKSRQGHSPVNVQAMATSPVHAAVSGSGVSHNPSEWQDLRRDSISLRNRVVDLNSQLEDKKQRLARVHLEKSDLEQHVCALRMEAQKVPDLERSLTETREELKRVRKQRDALEVHCRRLEALLDVSKLQLSSPLASIPMDKLMALQDQKDASEATDVLGSRRAKRLIAEHHNALGLESTQKSLQRPPETALQKKKLEETFPTGGPSIPRSLNFVDTPSLTWSSRSGAGAQFQSNGDMTLSGMSTRGGNTAPVSEFEVDAEQETEFYARLDQLRANRLKQASFRNEGLLPYQISGLMDVVQLNKSLHTLDLSENRIDEKGARSINEALQSNSTLRTLILKSCCVDDHGLSSILKLGLVYNKGLHSLDLQGNSIRSEGASHLAELLEQNTSLTALNLRGNYIGLDGMRFLARGLSVNRTLRFLDLSYNIMGETGAGGPFVGDVTAEVLTDALVQSNSVEVLVLEKCGIEEQGLKHLLRILHKDSHLRELYLQNNHIGNQGARLLFKVLVSNTVLRILDLSANYIGDTGTRDLAEGLASNRGLRKLVLAKNHIGVSGARALCSALRENDSLETLDCSHQSNLGDEGALLFAEALPSNSSLQHLDLRGNGISLDCELFFENTLDLHQSKLNLVLDHTPFEKS